MATTYLDTHVAVWLYAGKTSRLSRDARRAINRDRLLISPMVLLEIDLLREIGRVHESGERILEDLSRRIGVGFSAIPFRDVISGASTLAWTLDPFDRILVGEASVAEANLVTKDHSIRENYSRAVW